MDMYGYTIATSRVTVLVSTLATEKVFFQGLCQMLTKISPFRTWLHNMWYEHVNELDSWGMPKPDYTSTVYFQRFRWWLRAEYRRQQQ